MLPDRLDQLDPTAALEWSTEVDLFDQAAALRRGSVPERVDQIDALAMIVNRQSAPRAPRQLVSGAPVDCAGADRLAPLPAAGSARRHVTHVRRPVLALAAGLAVVSVGVGAAVARQGGSAAPPVSAAGLPQPVAIAVISESPGPLAAATATGTATASVPVSAVSGPPGALGAAGIPAIPLSAYQRAATSAPRACALPWWLIAAIGKVETDHAAAGRVDRTGTVRGHIYGPRLDGTMPGTQTLTDSDRGSVDGDPAFDRAVGPMQILPATWAWAKRDGNGDSHADPQNVYDAARAAALVLCQPGPIGDDERAMARAALRYNNSAAYAGAVVTIAVGYRDATTPKPSATTTLAPSGPPTTSRPAPPPTTAPSTSAWRPSPAAPTTSRPAATPPTTSRPAATPPAPRRPSSTTAGTGPVSQTR